jgi:RNA recognition motif-containing protein
MSFFHSSKGCGIVEYSSPHEAQVAIAQLTNTTLDGREIFVREDREAKNGTRDQGGGSARVVSNHQGGGCKVYVGNLSWETQWQGLKDHMRQAGNVTHADVFMGNDGRSRGGGIVEYGSAQEAAVAIASLTDTELDGRMIFVREDRE